MTASSTHAPGPIKPAPAGTWREVFAAFARLGVTAFGGPVAHLGYFRDAFVIRRRWLDEAGYAELVALGQLLPGPTSSQVGFAIGLHRAGLAGGLAAWCAFTLPSALIMVAAAYGLAAFAAVDAGWLQGLKIAAVAVVAHALWGMAQSLCPDRPRAGIALIGAIIAIGLPGAWGQVGAIATGALAGLALPASGADQAGAARATAPPDASPGARLPDWIGVAALVLFAALLGVLPLAAWLWPGGTVALIDAVYRAGALVFGGGHVVLPLLEAHTVRPGFLDQATFLAGYGAAQAVPGPLFTVAAYIGALSDAGPGGVAGAAIALVAIFLPGLLLVLAVVPVWARMREFAILRRMVIGVNAAVVGLLAAVLYTPILTQAVPGPGAMAGVLAALLALAVFRLPPWLVVIGSGLAGWVVIDAI